MRATFILDDDLAARLKEEARQRGVPFKAVVNETLRAGLSVLRISPKAQEYRLKPASLGEAFPGVNLDKALQLSASFAGEATAGKLGLHE